MAIQPNIRMRRPPASVRPAAGRPERVLPRTVSPTVLSVVGLLALTLIAAWRIVAGRTVVGQDSATQFYPWYSYLGERLRSFDVPSWSPYQFSGAPFAADPQSGWMYFPAMLFFAALPLPSAADAFILFHLALAGLATFALARRLGMTAVGCLTAAIAYEFSGLMYGRSVCCPVHIQVAAWMPVMLVGVEGAVRAQSWAVRVRWWGMAGLALSQILASWLGQGAYYALLVLGGYIGYRSLLDPPEPGLRPRDRFGMLASTGSAILAIGFGLAAAGLIPRLQYNGHTNLSAGRYQGEQVYAAVVGGLTLNDTPFEALHKSLYYPGGAAVALAIVALVLALRRYAAPFFIALSVVALVLAVQQTTPLHMLLYLLPGFEDLHRHWPQRVAVAAALGPAMLAGAAVSSLGSVRHRLPSLLLAMLLPLTVAVGMVAVMYRQDRAVPEPAIWAGIAVVVILAVVVAAWMARRQVMRLAPAFLLVVVALDLLLAGPRILTNAPFGGFHEVDLDAYGASTGAAAFIESRQDVIPSRYFGYDPALQVNDNGWPVLYRYQFADPMTRDLLVNNRATLLGLEDIQGYNPVQIRRYVNYIAALNGHDQEYHDANVYPHGLGSPLIDLLGTHYIVVPAAFPADRPDLAQLVEDHPTVYQDAAVRVLENTEALPRAWIVHEARQVTADEALGLLASGAVDPRRTALLEKVPPALVQPAADATERATITSYEPEQIRLDVSTAAAGLLVLGEVNYPAWHAYVDGKRVSLLVADYLLRAVWLPAGRHIVEFRYESKAEHIGLAATLATVVVLGGVIGVTTVNVRRSSPAAATHYRRREWRRRQAGH